VANGSFAYSSYLGGEKSDVGRAIAVAPSGLVYFAGSTYGETFPIAGNALQPNTAGGGDIFLCEMDLTRSGEPGLLYSTFFGGSGLDEVRKMMLDSSGKLLLTGVTTSPDFPVTAGAVQPTFAGVANAFLARLDVTGPDKSSLLYSTYLGGSGGDVAYD